MKKRLQKLLNLKVKIIEIHPTCKINTNLGDKKDYLKDKTLQDVIRIGKYLILEFDDLWILNHLKMTGSWQIQNHAGQTTEKQQSKLKYWRVRFDFGEKLAFYSDVRQFGILWLYEQDPRIVDNSPLKNIGIDVRDPMLEERLKKQIKEKKWQRKILADILLDQSFVAGIGNIYRSEILFEAKISPFKRIKELSSVEIQRLIIAIRNVMRKAFKIEANEYPFEDGYAPKEIEEEMFAVYGKSESLCKHCQRARIERIKWKQRSVFYCPNCQQ